MISFALTTSTLLTVLTFPMLVGEQGSGRASTRPAPSTSPAGRVTSESQAGGNAQERNGVIDPDEPIRQRPIETARPADAYDEDKDDDGDDRSIDPDASPPSFLEPSPGLELGLRLSTRFRFDRNEDLESADSDDAFDITPRATLGLLYRPEDMRWLRFHFEGRSRYDLELAPELDRQGFDFELRELYVRLRHEPWDDTDLRIGRQRLDDDREWLFDMRRDGVRFDVDTIDRLNLQFSVTSDVIDPEDNDDEIIDVITYNRIDLPKRNDVRFWGIWRAKRSGADEDRVYLGAGWRGEPLRKNRYDIRSDAYVDFSTLFGSDENERFEAFAIDAGWAARFRDRPLEPTLLVGLAYGSGDRNTGDDVNREFRQTGVHGNEDNFNGLVTFKYYGEALDPELSNLLVGTLGAGLRPTDDTSIDLVYHYYWQPVADNRLRGRQNVDPTGDSNDLGHGLDLIYGQRLENGIRLRLNAGVFLPGDAFEEEEEDPLIRAEFEVQYVS